MLTKNIRKTLQIKYFSYWPRIFPSLAHASCYVSVCFLMNSSALVSLPYLYHLKIQFSEICLTAYALIHFHSSLHSFLIITLTPVYRNYVAERCRHFIYHLPRGLLKKFLSLYCARQRVSVIPSIWTSNKNIVNIKKVMKFVLSNTRLPCQHWLWQVIEIKVLLERWPYSFPLPPPPFSSYPGQ